MNRTLLVLLAVPALAAAPAKVSPETQAVYKDIETSLGVVPEFFRVFPESALPGAWEEFKGLMGNPNTAIPPKYKEMIGLAVSAQIPCKYCVYAHTQFAKMNGASDDEIREMLTEAALTRHWSTLMNGAMLDETQFRADITKIVERMKKMATQPPPATPPAAIALNTPADVFRDAEATFGFVPGFMKTIPDEAMVGAYKEWKAVEMTPGAVPGKYKLLGSLAVAAQVPCRYCIIADTQFASVEGATERELKEAVAIAAFTRHWSTYLNGIQLDEVRFKKDVDKIVATMKKKMAAAPAAPTSATAAK